MATRAEIRARAKDLIESNPTAGKARINQQLRAEFGVGLRSSNILTLKAEVASERPRLMPELYGRGTVPKGLNEIYRGWIRAGFLAFEARELTVGHGDRYRAFDAKAVFDSVPGQLARKTRTELVRQQLRAGWTKQQVRENIIDFYKKSRRVDPWEHIRAEYKPRKRVDFADYAQKARRQARTKQKRLQKPTPPTYSRAEWIAQLQERMDKSPSPQERQRFRQQIINLGGTP